MRMSHLPLVAAILLGWAPLTRAASLFEVLGLKRSASAVTSLSEEQIVSGLKEALARGTQFAVTNLGRDGGFLQDAKVKIPLPDSLKTVEKTLRKLRQDRLADEFITTMNQAAERAVPQAASVLGDAVKQLTVADARGILTGPNTAATDYFRRTSETNLYARFLPIVQAATTQTGVTSAYKRMTDMANLGNLGGIGTALFGPTSFDLDDYVTHKAMDGLFLKIAEQEKLIRANPAARTTELLQQVFGASKK